MSSLNHNDLINLIAKNGEATISMIIDEDVVMCFEKYTKEHLYKQGIVFNLAVHVVLRKLFNHFNFPEKYSIIRAVEKYCYKEDDLLKVYNPGEKVEFLKWDCIPDNKKELIVKLNEYNWKRIQTLQNQFGMSISLFINEVMRSFSDKEMIDEYWCNGMMNMKGYPYGDDLYICPKF